MNQSLITRDLVNSLDELLKLSETLLKSGMLPAAVKSKEAAAAIILKGREIGMPAMESFSLINVIAGKPTIAPQGMLALIYRSHQLENLIISDDGLVCIVTMQRKGHEPHMERFGMDDAKRMMTQETIGGEKKTIPLADKYNWRQMPATMRKWRAVSACARVVFPDVIAGMYTPEELGADVDEEGEVVEAVALRLPPAIVTPPAQVETRTGNGHDPEPATVKAETERAPTGKTPKITASGWREASTALAGRFPHYAGKDGKPNGFHMANAAGKLGFADITDDNLASVIYELEEYAKKQAEPEAA